MRPSLHAARRLLVLVPFGQQRERLVDQNRYPRSRQLRLRPSFVVEPEADDYRPTAGPEFTPTPEEEAEAAELLNGNDEPDWDVLADDAMVLDAVCSGASWL
jgi:hypothetical protein